MKIEELIKQKLREDEDLTLSKIARKTGLPLSFVYEIADGTREPDEETTEAICSYFGVDPHEHSGYRRKIVKDAIKKNKNLSEEVYQLVIAREKQNRSKKKNQRHT